MYCEVHNNNIPLCVWQIKSGNVEVIELADVVFSLRKPRYRNKRVQNIVTSDLCFYSALNNFFKKKSKNYFSKKNGKFGDAFAAECCIY